ncbi:hypothetical protein FGO68_gene7829 [Halteria grandinella]|uniref:Uncharacterized protein n=1 Tax=Halteria grandinella TaxID=5974 RepID=A0A8J8SW59_HALGN|nr:hypothetical protein FGO68_gene7829 [Halteria grandinella]
MKPNATSITEYFIFLDSSSCLASSSPSKTPGLSCKSNCRFFYLSTSFWRSVLRYLASSSVTMRSETLLGLGGGY